MFLYRQDQPSRDRLTANGSVVSQGFALVDEGGKWASARICRVGSWIADLKLKLLLITIHIGRVACSSTYLFLQVEREKGNVSFAEVFDGSSLCV